MDALEVYISVDVEADGPYPGDYSMTSLGACVAGYMTAEREYVRVEKSSDNTFYSELMPISDKYDPEAFAVGVFQYYTGDPKDEAAKRLHLLSTGEQGVHAMRRFYYWVAQMQNAYSAKGAVFCAYPLGFDWLFTYWYMMKFAQSPFGHSRHIDIKTLYMTKAKQSVSRAVKSNMPKSLRPKVAHTHNALDDALEQGELMMNLLLWEGK